MYGEPGSFAILQLCACQRPDFLILKGTRLFFPETFKNTLKQHSAEADRPWFPHPTLLSRLPRQRKESCRLELVYEGYNGTLRHSHFYLLI